MHIYLFISLEIKNNYPAAIMYLITPLKKKKKHARGCNKHIFISTKWMELERFFKCPNIMSLS